MFKFNKSFASALGLGALLLAGAVEQASAAPRAGASANRTAVRTGPAGQSVTTQGTTTRTANGAQRSRVTTGPNGAQSSASATVERTESGVSRDVVRTGPAGKVRGVQSDVAVTPAPKQ